MIPTPAVTPVLQAVPNFSEGRDAAFPAAAAAAFERAGCDVVDASADPDHHRSVVTVLGPPGALEDGAVSAAALAMERIDLRRHQGVHPRVGALDVLPFVPLRGLSMDEAVKCARRAGGRIAGLGVPVYFYRRASRPPGRGLAAIRRGGYEALACAVPGSRPAADLPGLSAARLPVHPFAHPSAGATCVGARPVLLAWNVDLEGVDLAAARRIAAALRESGGGFRGLRAMAVRLPRQGRLQVSMNLEDPRATPPETVYRAIERKAREYGGRTAGAEVVGAIPDALAGPEVARALGVRRWSEDRLLDRRVRDHLAARTRRPA